MSDNKDMARRSDQALVSDQAPAGLAPMGFDPSRDELPTKDQIWAIDDKEALHSIRDSVMEAVKTIEVDLEYRSDDAADEFWERRARKALSHYKICEAHLSRRLAYLTRGGPAPAPDPSLKTRKLEAQAQLEAATAERKRAKVHEEREKTVRQILSYADRHSFLAHFYKVARDHLDNKTMGDLVDRARKELADLLGGMLPAIETETRRAETLGSVEDEGSGLNEASPNPSHSPSQGSQQG